MDADARRVVLRALALCAVGLGLLLLTSLGAARLLADQDPRALLASLSPGWLLLAVAAAVFGQGLHGLRVRLLLPPAVLGPRPPGVGWLGWLYLASIVLNLSFPGPAGELAAALVVRRRAAIPATATLAASLHGRFAGVLTGSLGLLLALPWLPVSAELAPYLWGGGAVVGLGGAVLALLSLRPGLLARLGHATVGRLSGVGGPLGAVAARVDAQVALFSGYLGAVATRPRAYLLAMGTSALMLATFVGATLLAARAVGSLPAVAGAFLAVTSSQLTSIAAVAVPGGLGIFDLAFGGALVAVGGLSVAAAAAVTVAIRAVQVLVLVPGVLAFLGVAGELLAARREVEVG